MSVPLSGWKRGAVGPGGRDNSMTLLLKGRLVTALKAEWHAGRLLGQVGDRSRMLTEHWILARAP